MSNAASHTPVRRAAVIFVFVTVMLDMLAFGIIIPVFPHLVQQMTGGDIANAVRWTGIMGAVFGLMQFVFSPVQGALSDRFGRRPVILASNLSLGLDFILMALAQVLPVLFIGRMISGIASASISTANAYIADVTPHDKRAAAYGLLGAAFGIGHTEGGHAPSPHAFGLGRRLLDLRGHEISAAADDHVFEPARDEEFAVRDVGEIAGVEEAARSADLRGGLFVSVIARGH